MKKKHSQRQTPARGKAQAGTPTTGMRVAIYRAADGDDATNGGLSSNHTQATIIGIEGPYEVTEEAPALYLVKRLIGGRDYIHVQPTLNDGRWYIAGRNFAYSSDSRFSKLTRYPIPVHDRTDRDEPTAHDRRPSAHESSPRRRDRDSPKGKRKTQKTRTPVTRVKR